jgi:NAD(P)-dependent dehydrogenase (short-subunit alcohol dehydrogenase family)
MPDANASFRKAYIVTGPTSGIGRATAFAPARHGTLVLVGRDRAKLDALQADIARKGGDTVPVVCDLSDIPSARRAAAEIAARDLPVAGLLNNAGIRQEHPTKSAQGWDMTFATNHLGPFAFTGALLPHLANDTNVLFVASAVEDPERRLAAAGAVRFVATYVLPLLVPFIKHMSTPRRAARVLTKILTDEAGRTGVYYDESGHPMPGSAQVRDPAFTARVAAETRALLGGVG